MQLFYIDDSNVEFTKEQYEYILKRMKYHLHFYIPILYTNNIETAWICKCGNIIQTLNGWQFYRRNH